MREEDRLEGDDDMSLGRDGVCEFTVDSEVVISPENL
jgi:hypothetical protein